MNREYELGRRVSRPDSIRRPAVMLAWFTALALLAYFWSWGLLDYLAFLFKPFWGN